MYQIKCDDFILYDPRIEEFRVLNPKCKLETSTAGDASFVILQTHPNYSKLKRLKSIFEIKQNDDVIFRGRMTGDSKDFQNRLDVDLEGVLAFANDSIIEPFDFPADFPEAEAAENIVEYFFRWVLAQHNARVENWKQLKPGNVTVSDPNNYITRASSEYSSTWNILKTKLLDTLGGYICVRYEDDGNYVDYLSEFELTNVQPIEFGKNLLDVKQKTDANSTYSAILPTGAEVEVDGVKKQLTLEDLPDGDLTDDLVKQGKYIYSKSAKENYGWICVPQSESKWDDVTVANNLKNKAMEYLTGTAMLFSNDITFKALDLGFTDDETQSFRINRNVLANSTVHGLTNEISPLTKLDIDILNPQNTKITIGKKMRTLTDINTSQQIENVQNSLKEYVSAVEKDLTQKIETIDGVYFYIKYSAYADGHIMTNQPTSTTKYMGTCSTNTPEAPSDYNEYTWTLVRGEDGKDAILLMIDSSAGNLFKNSNIATTLTVTIIVGDIIITDSARMKEIFGNSAKLKWQIMRFGETEYTDIAESDTRLSDNGFIFTLSANDVNTKAIFNCLLDF